MTREIKFRAWDRKDRKMITKENFKTNPENFIEGISITGNFSLFENNTYRDSEDFELMQFTELFDNTKWEDLPQYEQQLFRISLGTEYGEEAKKKWKGKEIYEGDIVRTRWIEDDKIYVGKVIFEEGHFCLEIEDIFKPIFQNEYSSYIRELEVIGNIYENPELLENKK